MENEVRKRAEIEVELARYLLEKVSEAEDQDDFSPRDISKMSLNFLIDNGHLVIVTLTDQRTDWDQMKNEVFDLIKRLQKKPKSKKLGYSISPGGILNAYREGDLTFNQAVKALKRKWKK